MGGGGGGGVRFFCRKKKKNISRTEFCPKKYLGEGKFYVRIVLCIQLKRQDRVASEKHI